MVNDGTKIFYLCAQYGTKTYTIILKGSITLFGLLQTYCRFYNDVNVFTCALYEFSSSNTFFSDRIIIYKCLKGYRYNNILL